MPAAEEILVRLDSLRDRRMAQEISETDYRSQWDGLWNELRAADRAKNEIFQRQAREEVEQIRKLERQARRRQTDPTSPYKTLRAAFQGWMG